MEIRETTVTKTEKIYTLTEKEYMILWLMPYWGKLTGIAKTSFREIRKTTSKRKRNVTTMMLYLVVVLSTALSLLLVLGIVLPGGLWLCILSKF